MNSNTPIQINALNALVETARQKVASSMFSQHCKFETIDQTDNSAAQRIAFRTLDFGDMIVSYARGAKTMERALPNEPILVAFDGASRGNPGPAAAAAVIYTTKTSKVGMVPDQVLVEESELLNGNRTSNQAEYEALIVGLKRASLLKAKNVICQGDSELVIRQMDGAHTVHNSSMKLLNDEARRIIENSSFKSSCKFKHVLRTLNSTADRLANETLDKKKNILRISPAVFQEKNEQESRSGQPEFKFAITQKRSMDPIRFKGIAGCDFVGDPADILNDFLVNDANGNGFRLLRLVYSNRSTVSVMSETAYHSLQLPLSYAREYCRLRPEFDDVEIRSDICTGCGSTYVVVARAVVPLWFAARVHEQVFYIVQGLSPLVPGILGCDQDKVYLTGLSG
ncbi:ribonuclease H-like domain-containing protein [Obelidium mucronatum]|nr:ribonuclease H-like domain-containing protein [Obelidium mucronatum]